MPGYSKAIMTVVIQDGHHLVKLDWHRALQDLVGETQDINRYRQCQYFAAFEPDFLSPGTPKSGCLLWNRNKNVPLKTFKYEVHAHNLKTLSIYLCGYI